MTAAAHIRVERQADILLVTPLATDRKSVV